MIILILTLIFGLAVLIFTAISLKKAKEKKTNGKIVTILKLVVLVETLVYLGLFVFVFIKTLMM